MGDGSRIDIWRIGILSKCAEEKQCCARATPAPAADPGRCGLEDCGERAAKTGDYCLAVEVFAL